mgnify:FL=1
MVPASLRQFAAVLLLTALVAPAVAAPPPEPLCGPCSGFETAAAEAGIGVELERATARVALADNGSATWTVRLRVNEAAAQTFANDPEQRRAVATDAVTRRGLPSVTDPVGLSTSVSGETVVVRFRDPDATDREAGLFVVDFLRSNGQLTVDAADRVTLRGPPGTTVLAGSDVVTTNDTDDPQTVTLYNATMPAGGLSDLENSVVVFGPPNTSPGVPTFAVAATVVPPWLGAVIQFGTPSILVGVVLVSGLAVLLGWVGRREWEPTTTGRRFLALTGVATVPVVTVVSWGDLPVGLLAVLGSYAVVGSVVWRRPGTLRSAGGVAAVTVAAGIVTFTGTVALTGRPVRAIQTVCRIAPVVVGPAIGAVSRRLVAATVGTASVVVVVATVVGPTVGGLVVLVAMLVVVVVVLLAAPPAVVAAAVSRQRPDEPS